LKRKILYYILATKLASKFSFSIYKKETVWRFFFHLLSLTEYSFIHVKVQELFLSMASTSRNEKKVSGANNYIPESIAYSILSKLPLKSLKRFSTEIVLHGFVYDHFSDDYKVIQHVSYIAFNESSDDIHGLFWEIYSLKSNSWKKCNFDIPVHDWITSSDVYLNGVCHWWGKVNNESFLVSFNLCNEVWLTTPSPIENVQDGDVDLVVLYGHMLL
jgi:hypothetical protein